MHFTLECPGCEANISDGASDGPGDTNAKSNAEKFNVALAHFDLNFDPLGMR